MKLFSGQKHVAAKLRSRSYSAQKRKTPIFLSLDMLSFSPTSKASTRRRSGSKFLGWLVTSLTLIIALMQCFFVFFSNSLPLAVLDGFDQLD